MDAIARRRQLSEIGDRLLVVDEIAVLADRKPEDRFGGRDRRRLGHADAWSGDDERDGGASCYRAPAESPRHRKLLDGESIGSKMRGRGSAHQCTPHLLV